MIIWLASYPRSGNTLTRSIFNHYFKLKSLSIYGDRGDIGSNGELGELIGHEEGSRETIDIEALRSDKDVHLIKTHDCPSPEMSPEDSYIHILRDGRDSVVSFMHYLRDIVSKNDPALADVKLQDVITGQVPFGSWGNHTMLWHEFKAPRLFRFRFEDFRNDVPGFASKLSGIVGREASSKPFPGIETFQKAAPNFIRSGKIGGWRGEFSEADLSLFDMFNGFAMRIAGYGEPKLGEHEFEAYSRFCETIRGMQDEMRQWASQSRSLRMESDTLHNKIFEMNAEVASMRERVRELGEDASRKDAQLHSLNDELLKRDGAIDAWEQEHQQCLDRTRLLDKELEVANKKIAYLEPKLKKYFRYMNRFKSMFGVRPHKVPWDD